MTKIYAVNFTISNVKNTDSVVNKNPILQFFSQSVHGEGYPLPVKFTRSIWYTDKLICLTILVVNLTKLEISLIKLTVGFFIH